MATFYYGGSGSDPLIRIEVYETATPSTFSVIVTQVYAIVLRRNAAGGTFVEDARQLVTL